MRSLKLPIVALALISAAALAQSNLVSGEVVKVDPSAASITIKHGPIPKLEMDQGMTMVFHANDANLLTSVKAGDRVRFDAENVNGQFVVTKIEKTR
jgi:Cu(I)/Ag(I) efflux system periplasmic protein CusF